MTLRNPLPIFAAVTLTAPALIAAGAIWGSVWALSGWLWISVLAAILDEFVNMTLATAEGDEFPAAVGLTITLAVVHMAVWVLVIATAGGATGLVTWEKCLVIFSAGLFMGQVSNSNAHELIHRPSRWLRRAGRWVYISVLFGHHCSAHPLVHHIHVGTHADPSTARRGEHFYRFFFRAWKGSFIEGLRAENKRFPRSNKPTWKHPYVAYILGAIVVMMAAFIIGGPKGLLAGLFLAGFTQLQLMQADYVQHYGLFRKTLPNGKYEPVSERHSWNTPHIMSSALMLNAPRHSDHHANPIRPFPSLRLSNEIPMLPRSLPVMAVLALFPKTWHRVMDPRAAQWQDGAE